MYSSGPKTIIKTVLLALAFASTVAQGLQADAWDAVFLPYAATIEMRSWRGTAIYLGGGLFLTAAHVVGRSWLTQPAVVLGERKLAAVAVKEGSAHTTDLTLLAVQEDLLPMRLRLRKTRLCTMTTWPGEEVVTVAPNAVVHSHIISSQRLPPDLRHLTSVIGDVASTGNSGSGVFDLQRKCLLGIITQKISQSRPGPDAMHPQIRDIAKYFVPAPAISAFMPAGYEFRALQ